MEENRERAIKDMYKGHTDKAKGGRTQGGRREWVGLGVWRGGNGDNCP